MNSVLPVAALFVSACALPQGAPAPVNPAWSVLEGAWSNQPQYDAAPDALKRDPAPGHPYDWLDLQYAEFFTVEAPQLGEAVVYLEWRAGAPDGPISRQRIWVFHDDAQGRPAGMDFYTFADPDPYAGRGAQAGAFTDLSLADMIGYPDGCTLRADLSAAEQVVFEADPNDCVITARSGRAMGIRARITLGPDRLAYSEAGVLGDGSYAFLVPGGERLAYQFTPME